MDKPNIEQDPTLNDRGDETHPAFGLLGVSRVSASPPGASLFDSEIRHSHYVTLRIQRAARTRNLNRDWIHTTPGMPIVEVSMSEAQWAQAVSTMNHGEGTPVTITWTETDQFAPTLPHSPRLADTTKEARGAADKAFAAAREALDKYEAHQTVGNLRTLRAALDNAGPNVEYAARTLSEHAEEVVTKARVDVEAMVAAHARTLGIDPADMAARPALEAPQENS